MSPGRCGAHHPRCAQTIFEGSGAGGGCRDARLDHAWTMGIPWILADFIMDFVGLMVVEWDLTNKNSDFMDFIPSGYLLHSHGIDSP